MISVLFRCSVPPAAFNVPASLDCAKVLDEGYDALTHVPDLAPHRCNSPPADCGWLARKECTRIGIARYLRQKSAIKERSLPFHDTSAA